MFVHTCHCCDALVKLPGWKEADEESRIAFALGVLTHDFGKATTTERVEREGRERTISPGHEEAGVAMAEHFLRRIDSPNAIIERVLPLVRNHMAHLNEVTDRSVRRLARRLVPETIDGLCVLMTADAFGRPPRPLRVPASAARNWWTSKRNTSVRSSKAPAGAFAARVVPPTVWGCDRRPSRRVWPSWA